MKKNILEMKKPQYNEEAESAVIGSIIIDEELLYKAEEYITADDFYLQKNKKIFEIMLSLREDREPIDILTISNRLKMKQIFEEIGGITYLANMVTEIPMRSHFDGYCKIVRDTSLLRRLSEISLEIYLDSFGEHENISELMEEAEKKILTISQSQPSGDFENPKEVIKDTLKNIENNIKNKGKLTGLPTGFSQLDKCTAGFQKSDLIYIAARPSMGKTSFALNIAGHMALKHGASIAVFSLEMSKIQLMQRLICGEAYVDLSKVRSGEINAEAWNNISNTASRFFNSKIYIDDTGSASLNDIRTKSRKLKAKQGLDMILIDYLQLMSNKKKSENRQAEISEISRGLKAIAREMDCPVVCLSQLSRAADSRADHKPVLADLRESGSIEQDADVVLFLYREHYYTPDETDNINQAELLISKQRNGPTGKIDLVWRPEWTKFTDVAESGYDF